MDRSQAMDEASIVVRYFAATREIAGRDEERLPLPRGAGGGPYTVRDLAAHLAARHPRLAPHLARIRFAINGEFVKAHDAVRAGDEVALIPPVAGGAPSDAVALVAIRESALSIDETVRAVSHPGAGGIAIFLGIVRDHADGKPVARLDYEAYLELALKEMRRILEAICAEHPGVRLAATHRIGQLAIGDTAVIVTASAPHRAEAFTACWEAIDRIKETVPIWKKEWTPTGEALWVNWAASPEPDVTGRTRGSR